MNLIVTITTPEGLLGVPSPAWNRSDEQITRTIKIPDDTSMATIERVLELLAANPGLSPHDILYCGDCVATTLWGREDIAGRLIDKHYEATEENIDAVINSGELRHLGDCQDFHWDIIDQAIDNVLGKAS